MLKIVEIIHASLRCGGVARVDGHGNDGSFEESAIESIKALGKSKVNPAAGVSKGRMRGKDLGSGIIHTVLNASD